MRICQILTIESRCPAFRLQPDSCIEYAVIRLQIGGIGDDSLSPERDTRIGIDARAITAIEGLSLAAVILIVDVERRTVFAADYGQGVIHRGVGDESGGLLDRIPDGCG